MAVGQHILWGTPHSLYTGKARSYLIKKQIAFAERVPGNPHFLNDVVPAIGHMVLPVLETADGQLVQDTSAIIDHLDTQYPEPDLTPPGGVQQVVANFLDAFGSNYLLPLAMHYRWTYRAEQELFLQAEFARAVPPAIPYEQRLAMAGAIMNRFNGFLPNLGVTPAVIPAMEESYRELLAVLEAHFRLHPYLLGGRPSLADFGMMAPLYAHLARDPVPALLMRTIAPNVARWTERMNSPAIIDSDYADDSGAYPSDNAIPASLEDVLRVAFSHWAPGLAADAAQFEQWLASLGDAPSGTLVSHDGKRQVHPHVGRVSYAWRGVTMERASQPHSLWHLARAQALADRLPESDAHALQALLARTGGAEVMAIRTTRPIKRSENVLVLA